MARDELLRSRAITMSTRMLLTGYNGEIEEDVTDRLILRESFIARDATAKVDGQATFVFDDVSDIDFGRQLLAPSITITDDTGRYPELTWRMGNWVPQTPSRSLQNPEKVRVECYDTVSLLNTQIEGNIEIPPGRNIASAITDILIRHGMVGLAGVVDEARDPLRIGWEMSGYGQWSYLQDITYLDVINQLLEASSFVGMFTNRFGELSSYEWQPVETKSPRWHFNSSHPDSYIGQNTMLETPIDQIPNVWIAVNTALDSPQVIEPIRRTLGEGSLSPYSISNRGGRRNVRVLKIDVATTADLERALDEIIAEDLSRIERVRISTKAPLPHLWQSDRVRVTIPEFDLYRRLGICREWRLPLDVGRQNATYTVDMAPEGTGDDG